MDSLKFNQIGSKKGFWTADLTLKTLIDEYISKIKNFVDFLKAYDSIWRECLFYKLMSYSGIIVREFVF